jgi:hypothetical protein
MSHKNSFFFFAILVRDGPSDVVPRTKTQGGTLGELADQVGSQVASSLSLIFLLIFTFNLNSTVKKENERRKRTKPPQF